MPFPAVGRSETARSCGDGLVIRTRTLRPKIAVSCSGSTATTTRSRLSTASVDSAELITGEPAPSRSMASAATTNGYRAPIAPGSGRTGSSTLVISPGCIGPTATGSPIHDRSRPITVIVTIAGRGPGCRR